MKILVTGGAGFIGSHVVEALHQHGHSVVVVDDFNDYYSPAVKWQNVLAFPKSIQVVKGDITDAETVEFIFRRHKPHQVVHLAGRPGVRGSQSQADLYVRTNVLGTSLILSAAKNNNVQRVIFSSSSSVYGNSRPPFAEDMPLPSPLSMYAATKQAAELLAEQYSNSGLPVTLFRFFSVYGERGRPDMAPYLFTSAVLHGKPITIFGDGTQLRDFTYVKDIVAGVVAAVEAPTHFGVMNLGNNTPIQTLDFVQQIEKISGKKANLKFAPARREDAAVTWANTFLAKKNLGWEPQTNIDQGLTLFIDWFRTHRL